jgi:hypothetical protein
MKFIVSLVKEVAEWLLRNLKKIRFLSSKYGSELDSLSRQGYHIVPNYLTPETCQKFRHKIDNIIESGGANVWRDSEGADSRVYFIDELDQDFKDFYETRYFREVLKEYTGIADPKGMLLAGKIDAVDGNIGSGGGWHRDSPVTHQLKAICYLSDVEANNGPFQYIVSSNNKRDVVMSYLKKLFLPGQYRFTEDEIEIYMESSGNHIAEMTAKAGTLLFADTKGIHRGKPIVNSQRYVLFCYFWDKKIPDHFDRLRQI